MRLRPTISTALLTVLAGLLLLCAPASAEPPQSSGLKRLATGDDGRGWEAVGRLDMGHRSFCTGALIAPDLVLTAAHCLYDPETGARVEPAGIEFRAGWRDGRAEAYRGARRAVIHPEYRYEGRDRMDRVAHDLALIQLDRPIRNLRIRPFATAAAPRPGDAVEVVSYAEGRSEAPSIEQGCATLQRREDTLVLSCSISFGSSGAPVFTAGEDGPRLASVVAAMATMEGRPVALATPLDGGLALLREEMARGGGLNGGGLNGGEAAHFVGTERREIGARFVRP